MLNILYQLIIKQLFCAPYYSAKKSPRNENRRRKSSPLRMKLSIGSEIQATEKYQTAKSNHEMKNRWMNPSPIQMCWVSRLGYFRFLLCLAAAFELDIRVGRSHMMEVAACMSTRHSAGRVSQQLELGSFPLYQER